MAVLFQTANAEVGHTFWRKRIYFKNRHTHRSYFPTADQIDHYYERGTVAMAAVQDLGTEAIAMATWIVAERFLATLENPDALPAMMFWDASDRAAQNYGSSVRDAVAQILKVDLSP